jgi:RimJ/RimL family protein N-acetyltransferase
MQSSRSYKILGQQEFRNGNYSLVPIRDDDKYLIMKWRNEQLDILRQRDPLTKSQQETYFRVVVDKLFEEEKPKQLLFSFLEKGKPVAYGGLVHIDWESMNGEVSFIADTNRADRFVSDWNEYLTILKRIARTHLRFRKVYTYSYDVRPLLYQALSESGFVQEARLKDHVVVRGKATDVRIHSFFCQPLNLIRATQNDLDLYFRWVNDVEVRNNSFNPHPISLETHTKWFNAKLADKSSLLLIGMQDNTPVGQVRFDEFEVGNLLVDFSVASEFRGRGFGGELIRSGILVATAQFPHVKHVIAKVKTLNPRSSRVFQSTGFKKAEFSSTPGAEVYIFDVKQ